MSSNLSYEITPIEETENGMKYHIKITAPMTGWYDDMYFVVEKGQEKISYKINHSENKDGFVYFEEDITLDTRAIYRYYFSYFIDGKHQFHKKKELIKNDIIRDEMWKMAVNFEVPDWIKGKIMYHIFLDRFNRGSSEPLKEMPRRHIHKSWDEEMQIGGDEDGIWNNDFYGGDLQGITKKLDYIQSLGVSILYLSPTVYSQSNHRYDTSEYENVDPYAGTNEDLKVLCDEAHKRGMKVVLDAVFNHTGSDSKYFNKFGSFPNLGAYQSDTSPYSKFFRKVYNQATKKMDFDYWWGMDNLPVCDGHSAAWKEYITGKGGIIDQWFSLGIDGLRLDVADELTDEFIELIRTAVKRNKKDGFILGEVWKNPMRMNRGYLESGKGMDSVMNYPLVDALIRYFKYGDVHKLSYTINDILNEYPEETIFSLMNFTSTHDISRPLDIFGSEDEFSKYSEWAWDPIRKDDRSYCKDFHLTEEEYQKAKDIYMSYVTTLAFLPGVLSIFYGDEAGIQGLGNLSNRKTYPWNNEDQELIEFITSIGKLRLSQSFLERADLHMLKINRDFLMFERTREEESVLVTINRTDDIIMPFKFGAVKMCKETGADLIPFVITGKYKLFKRGITIEFLKPRKVIF